MNFVAELQKVIKNQLLEAYLQPVNDEFMSEYPPASNRRVAFISGFTGSAGTLVFTRDKAALFTDGRYTLQAQQELDASVYLAFNSGQTAPEAWLANELSPGDKVGYDPRLYTASAARRIEGVLNKKQMALVPVHNLIDPLWEGRPAAPATPLFIHALEHAGETSSGKRARIAARLAGEGADVAVLSGPDAVCWLLNIRARDVECTPLALVAALIDREGAVRLFIDSDRCSADVSAHLGNEVELCPPLSLEENLRELGVQKYSVLCDPATAPVWFAQTLRHAGARIVEAPDPCMLPKALKNDVELKGIHNAHVRDGAAVVKLLHWLEGISGASELQVADALRAFRAESPLFVEPSFNTIAGSGPNGAIVHYRAGDAGNRVLKAGELFLLDSGGQYPDGTTDITRTIPIGEPDVEHKDRFTRVLKGHIALATARFPEGTCGSQLDVLARQYLWQMGLDYDHGTGHGVGCFLGVHEGPQRISKRGGDAVLKPGMILSNEPGYYKTGAYGIRIENLVAVVAAHEGWLRFDTITCAPIDTRLVDAALLTAAEKEWLNAYHRRVLESLLPLLGTDAGRWLKKRCEPI